MDLESARETFNDEKRKWLAAREQWEGEYEKWEDSREEYEESSLLQQEFDKGNEQLQDRVEAAELARKVRYDTWRLRVLEIQVQESDERTLHEADALRGLFDVKLESEISNINKEHINTLAASHYRSEALDSLEAAKKSLEDRLAAARSTSAYWEKEETRLDISPNRAVLSPLSNNVSTSIPEKGLNREEERNRWAAQRKKLRDMLHAKQSKKKVSEAVGITVELSDREQTINIGDSIPQLSIFGKGLQDSPVVVFAQYPFKVFSRSASCTASQLTNGQCTINKGYLLLGLQQEVELKDAQTCTIKVVYPAVNGNQPLSAETTLQVYCEPCYSPARMRHVEDFVSVKKIDHNATSLHYASEVAKKLVTDVNPQLVIGTSYCRECNLLAVAMEREVRLFSLRNNILDCSMTLQVAETVHSVSLAHPIFIIITTKSATLLWERKLVHTWEQYATTLPATTARHRVSITDLIVCVDNSIVFIDESNRTLSLWDPESNPDMKHGLTVLQNNLLQSILGQTNDLQQLERSVSPESYRSRSISSSRDDKLDWVVGINYISEHEVVVSVMNVSFLMCSLNGEFTFCEIYRNEVNQIIAATASSTTSTQCVDGYVAAFYTSDGLLRLSSALDKPIKICEATVSFISIEPVSELVFVGNTTELLLYSLAAKQLIHKLSLDPNISLSWKNTSLLTSFPTHSDTGTCTEILFCCKGQTLLFRAEERPIVSREAAEGLPETFICCKKDWQPLPQEKPQPHRVSVEPSFSAVVPREFISEKVNDLVHGYSGSADSCGPPVELISSVDQSAPYLGLRVKDGGFLKPGALCISTNSHSPASQSGIEPGDTIVSVGESEVASAGDFKNAVRNYRVGDSVQFYFVDKGNTTKTTIVTFARKLETDFGIADSVDADSCCPEYGHQLGRRQQFSKKGKLRSRSPSIQSFPVDEISRSRSPSACSQNSFITTSSFSVDSQLVSWTPTEQKNLSTSNFLNTTPLNRFHGFLKANGAAIPTPANEATLRKAVLKFLTKLKLSRKRQTYIDWWKLTRPPRNAPIVVVE